MNAYRDFRRIIDQIRGQGNMFEYQTTLANQAYLMYSLLGEIYTTDRIHREIKLLILFAFATIVALEIAEITFFIVFYIHDDLLTQMYTLFVIFCPALMFTVVLMARVKRHLIKSTIEMIDKLVAKDPVDSHNNSKRVDTKVLLQVPIYYLSSLLPFLISCMIDVAMFYDESKVKNSIYYIIPLPKLEQYGSVSLFVVFNVGTSIAASTIVYATITVMILPLMWAIVCHNEVQRIAHNLSSLGVGDNLHMTAEFNASFERQFRSTIVQCVHAYRGVIRTVECFRGHYELMASILLPVVLLFAVIHAYILTTTNYSYIVKLKELSIFFVFLEIMYTYCWVGETLDEMTNTMSFAVYSTPWYFSTKVRKDTYIFLCQTQNPINPTAWSVYPLSLATFLRFMNVVQSSVNILRAVATK